MFSQLIMKPLTCGVPKILFFVVGCEILKVSFENEISYPRHARMHIQKTNLISNNCRYIVKYLDPFMCGIRWKRATLCVIMVIRLRILLKCYRRLISHLPNTLYQRIFG